MMEQVPVFKHPSIAALQMHFIRRRLSKCLLIKFRVCIHALDEKVRLLFAPDFACLNGCLMVQGALRDAVVISAHAPLDSGQAANGGMIIRNSTLRCAKELKLNCGTLSVEVGH